ncbi:unnamed protein product [Macrosiphum euphorbiae]|uniref:DUF4806 domain-containing protein n=1 Tax=Macrosiphum euphorbiae TaxID=13131 RepID=A0AAV0XCU5_9HEMI|nr:unnamed protein product [Macrosiphum euphorbiae]
MSSNQQCRKGRSLKRWVVAIFTDTKDFSVVPINWLNLDFNLEDLTQSNISSVQYCRWPPIKVTSLELMNADDAEETWQSFKIKIMDGKIYVNFKQAWHKQVEIEFSATESEQEPPSNKKKYQPSSCSKSLLVNLSDESNDYDDDDFYNVMASSQTTQTHSLAAPVPAAQSSSSLSTAHGVELNPDLTSDLTELMPILNKNMCSTSDISFKPINEIDTYNQTYLQQDNDPTVKMMLNRILIKISNIENILSKNHKDESILLDESFRSKFPLIHAEGFLLVETCILNENGFASKLKCFIRSIGGRDGKEHITRSLTKLFKNEYAGKCTMTGRGKNIITKIGDAELIKILTNVIKENSKNAITNSDIEREIAEWFRRANTRVQRDKQN